MELSDSHRGTLGPVLGGDAVIQMIAVTVFLSTTGISQKRNIQVRFEIHISEHRIKQHKTESHKVSAKKSSSGKTMK